MGRISVVREDDFGRKTMLHSWSDGEVPESIRVWVPGLKPLASGEGSDDYLSQLMGELQRGDISISGQFSVEDIEAGNARLDKLLDLAIQIGRPMKLAMAINAWANKETLSRKNEKPNPDYHPVLAQVKRRIDSYAREKGLEYDEIRAGRGKAYMFRRV